MDLDYSSHHLHEEAYSSPQTESGLQMFVSQQSSHFKVFAY